MSRQSSQPASSQPVFITQAQDFEGKPGSTTSTQALSEDSFLIDPSQNNALFATLAAFFEMIENNEHDSNGREWRFILPMAVMHAIAVMPGYVTLQNPANHTTVATIPRFPLFKMIQSHHVSTIVDAAMRGEETIVLQTITENPEALLQKWKVKNSVDCIFEVTPLQAAVMANDVQLIEEMKAHFERLTEDAEGNPIDGLAEMKNQLIEIYRVSLQRYCNIQAEKIQALRDQKDQYHAHVIAYQEERLKQYTTALEADDLEALIKTHDIAQEDNKFNFEPYIKAICDMDPNDPQLADVIALMNATTPDETAAVIARTGVSPIQTFEARAKPFDQLTLVEKLNHFREEFVAHMQREVIFNPNYILEGLKQNARIWDELKSSRFADPNQHKFMVIFSQLVGWTQRKAPEPVKQDLRQGTWYLIEDKEARRRPPRFNKRTRNDYVDISLFNSSVIDGVGYKFAIDGHRCVRWCPWATSRQVSEIVSSKNSKLSELVALLVRGCTREPVYRCSVM